MTADGLPVSISHISKMEDTVSVLLPYMPRLLENGLGRPQIEQLLSVRSTLKRVADSFLFSMTGRIQPVIFWDVLKGHAQK